jgi:ABC-type uncharacterized transport system permease subunit
VALRLRANIFVAGIATSLLASGLTTVLADRFFGYKGLCASKASILARW